MTSIRDHPHHWVRPAVILVPTDLNDIDRLMPFALEQAKETGARLILLHVLSSRALIDSSEVGMPYYESLEVHQHVEKLLQSVCEDSELKGVQCEALVREGNAAQQIGSVARQFNVDRILLGTRGRSKLSKLLVGSVAEQVLRSANIPVMTVGPEAHLPVDDGKLAAVLHATTLRETSRASAVLACRIAADTDAKLYLLHVMLPELSAAHRVDNFEGWNASSGDRMRVQSLRALAMESGAEHCHGVETMVVHGNPSIEILAAANEIQARLVVLTATHRSGLDSLARDRTVYRVLAHARCPVLTLREEAEEKDLLAEDKTEVHLSSGT